MPTINFLKLKVLLTEGAGIKMEKHTLGNLIPFANGTLSLKDRKKIISEVGDFQDYLTRKEREKEFLLDLIPDKKLNPSLRRRLIQKMFTTTDDLIPQEKFQTYKKIKKFLNGPAFTIKF